MPAIQDAKVHGSGACGVHLCRYYAWSGLKGGLWLG
jgi:hypothetical protein